MANLAKILCAREQPTAALAQAVAQTSFDGIPPDIVHRLQHSMLDWLGVAIAGAGRPEIRRLCALYGTPMIDGSATVFRQQIRTSPEIAAFLNGFAGHVLDFDDVIVELNGHPSAVVVPAVLAMAEVERVSGPRVIEALYAGIETVGWLGRLFGDRHYQSGWHATSILGTLGATAAVSRLLGAEAEAIEMALGLAGALTSGIQGTFGTSGKSLQIGNAAASAIRASCCIQHGLDGPTGILEKPGGLLHTHAGIHDSFRVFSSNEHESFVRRIILKRHASCFGTHATLQAIQQLMAPENPIADLQELIIQVSPQLYRVCRIDRPTSGDEIKFSLRTVAALALLEIDTGDLATYRTELAESDVVKAIAEKIRIHVVDEFPSTYCKIQATFMGGRIVKKTADSNQPITDLDRQFTMVRNKFSVLCQGILPALQRDTIIRQVTNLSLIENISDLMTQFE